MQPLRHRLARPVVITAAVLLTLAGCATGSTRTAPPRPSFTGVPLASVSASPAPVAAASVAPSVAPAETRTAVATLRPGPTPIVGEIRPAPEFVDLVTEEGGPFTLADGQGHMTLLFFGYTHCPDVCPATIGELMQVVGARPDVRVAFITIDPERDTQAFLAEWTTYMPAGLVGVTGSPLAIRHAADSYGVRYARVDTGSQAGYSMSHTAFQYLIDGDGNLVLTYPFGTPAAAIIGDLDQLASVG